MESEDIACLCASLSISEKDGPVHILEENLRDEAVLKMSLCLVGKILSNKTVNREAFMRVIGKIWRVNEGFEIESVTGNVYTFYFKNENDRQRVMSGGLWSFDNALMVLVKPEGKGTIESIQFRVTEFWVQIHQVPILCMTKKIGWVLGSLIGEVIEVDGGNAGETSELNQMNHGEENLQFGLWMRASNPVSRNRDRKWGMESTGGNFQRRTVVGGNAI
ncbi:hypothetical protein EZV62_022361 [Acer yangbiense]|uniref:DUF4283 domain-containing protein n=1 Tax=Acer yangbiense TaxID=1000413 RepID=A0A5C7H9G4_9ROSI|nr:hypothetical protein EZV62_022361 [Acer yangbiense]